MAEVKWWQKAVFYQVYPRSFADGNGDGVGDLHGLIDRLDYLQDLGIHAIWLSPHYPSPQFDCGYDVSDYTGVAPEYGSLPDIKRFLDEARQRGIRVVLDLVLNHTSDRHPWFLESRSSPSNPKRDWYVWRDAKDGQPPNNWVSLFGGSAWEYEPITGQYYYHCFFKEQPDLNWLNPEVRQAMWSAARFWFDLGVDGFRLDAIGTIFEDPALPDHPARQRLVELRRAWLTARTREDRQLREEQYHAQFRYQLDRPEVHDLMRELRALADEYPERVLVGETENCSYYGNGNDELHLVFNFPLMRAERLSPVVIRANQRQRLSTMPPGAWPCNTLGNHDESRVFSRFADGSHDAELARLSLALVLTLRGTPFLYYGEEIGMTDLLLDETDLFRDNLGVWFYKALVEEAEIPHAEALVLAARLGRDKCRTPMQWANAPNGGFSPPGVRTWLPVNPNYGEGLNVAEQSNDPGSLLSFYRRMLRLRQETPALVAGDYQPLHEEAEDYLAFLRHSGPDRQTCLVVLNMSNRTHTLGFDLGAASVRLLFSSLARMMERDDPRRLTIAPHEIYIAEVLGAEATGRGRRSGRSARCTSK